MPLPMDSGTLSQSPFAVTTFIAAPALLTNAASLLALSTINRMLRTRDRMKQLFDESEKGVKSAGDSERLVRQVNRVEGQALHLLRALHSIYVALGAFSAASLVTLLGAVLAQWEGVFSFHLLVSGGLALGVVGVGGLVWGCWNLLQATRLSLMNMREEADLIRRQQEAVRQRLSGAS